MKIVSDDEAHYYDELTQQSANAHQPATCKQESKQDQLVQHIAGTKASYEEQTET